MQLAALAMESVSMDGAFATHIGLVLHAPSLPRTSLLQSCTSPGIASAIKIDQEIANVVKSTSCTPEDIVVQAAATLPNGKVITATASIATSTSDTDSYLAVAQSTSSLDSYSYLESF